MVVGSFYLLFKKDLLSYFKGGHWWLTWLAIGVITLMDELTSIFYAPSEAFRYIGLYAIIFIPLTAIIIHTMTTRMVEVAEILDVHHLRGGGVYNFSYLVLGPLVSFVAVASIMVDYVLTAALSTVSAVENATYFFTFSSSSKIILELAMVWLMACLNIIGIRANAKVVFGIFLATAVVLLNLVAAGVLQMGAANFDIIHSSFHESIQHLAHGGWVGSYGFLIAGVSSCILAYSGVESVLQTASLVPNWKVVSKAYIFLALTVGIFTPLISMLVLSSPDINFAEHETNLMTHFATMVNGTTLGISVSAIASITLLMAMNTAFVASGELLERVAKRYGFHWISQTNRYASLYRVHILHAICFSSVILFTQGQQRPLAEMYAVGLVASFVINLASLIIYRYSKGTKEVRSFNVSRAGTIGFFIIILSCFAYLSYHKPHGFFLWLGATVFSLGVGIYGSRTRAPELKEIARGDKPMDILFYIAESTQDNVHIYFKRPFETPHERQYDLPVFITFYSPRQKIPPKIGENHFRVPYKRASVFDNIVAILDLLVYELPHKNTTVYFGWPTSSWYDRLSTGVMVFQLMKLPRTFPQINFKMEIFKQDKE